MIAKPDLKEAEKPHQCPATRNKAMIRDYLCLRRIAQGWKPCRKCEHKTRLEKIFEEGK